MAVKRRIRKKKIKEDRLVTYSVKVSQYAQDHFNQILTGIVILIVIIAALVFIFNSRRTAARESERYLGAALSLLRQGDVTAAKTSFQEVFDRYPRNKSGVISVFFMGECNLKLGNFSEAVSTYDTYLERSKKYRDFESSAVIGKATALEAQNKFIDAAEALESLINRLDPDDPRYSECLFKIASFYKNAGNQEKAIEYFTEVAEKGIDPYKVEAEIVLSTIKSLKSWE